MELYRLKCDHLFLLVGANPLPNYVAARLLGKSDGEDDTRFYLIHSEATEGYAGYLKIFLQGEFGEACVETLCIKESHPTSIRDKIENYFKEIKEGTIGLHYTGGTKAMAVHSYLTIKRLCETKGLEAHFSYLNPRELELRFDDLPGRPFKLGDSHHHTDADYFDQSSISLRHLLILHGHQPREPKPQEESWFENPRAGAWLCSLAKCLFDISMSSADLKGWRKWVAALRQQKNEAAGEYRRRVGQIKLQIPGSLKVFYEEMRKLGLVNAAHEFDLSLYPANVPKTNECLRSQPPAYVFAEWLSAKWMEDYILQAVVRLSDKCSLHDCGTSFEPSEKRDPRRPFFELDVVALRGYQLFAISCTTSSDKKECKLKLIEAYVRARQLGGDEARVGLVCMSSNPRDLRSQLERDLNMKDQLRVFGRGDLPKLEEHLERWFNAKG